MTRVDRVFRISIVLKGLSGLFETLGGLLLLLIKPEALSDAATYLTARELGHDPHDFAATSLLDVTNNLSTSTTVFAAVYLLGHGVVKLFLVWAVLRDRLWAFPLMMAFLLGFIGYQGYEMTVAFSWGLLLLTVFDVFVLWLTAIEFRKRRHEREVFRSAMFDGLDVEPPRDESRVTRQIP